MMSKVSNMFGSVLVRLALILGALATMTAAAIAISWFVFQSIAVNMEALTDERIPELQASAQVVSVADRVRGLLSDVLIAETAEDVAGMTEKKQLILADLQEKIATLPEEKTSEFEAIIAEVREAINQLITARQAEFASQDNVAATVASAMNVANTAKAILDRQSAQVFDELVQGSEDTVDSVGATLTNLVEDDFAIFQNVLAIQSEMNLSTGIALALSQSRDRAMATILNDLATSSVNRLDALAKNLSDQGAVEDVVDFVNKAKSTLQPVFAGNRLALTPGEILSLRQEFDGLISTTVDDLYFDLLIHSDDAKTENESAINGLMDNQVGGIRRQNSLETSLNEMLASIMMTALARDAEELEGRTAALQSASAKLSDAMAQSSEDIKTQLAGILAYANEESGISAIRMAALEAQHAATSSTQKAAASVRQIATQTSQLAGNAQSHIAASADLLTAEVAQARTQIQSIGILSLGLVLMAPVLVWWTVTRPLNRVTGITERLAQGDLSEIVGLDRQKGEIGRMAEALKVFRTGALERIEMQEAEKRREAEKQEAERAAERAKHEAEMRERQAQEDRAREQLEREAEEKAREDRMREEAEAERRARAKEQELVVGALAESLKRMSAGDLTHTIDTAFPGDYENLRQDYNAAISTLAELIRQIGQSSGLIDSGSAEIAASSLDLSRRTENSAATLEETAAALSELTASVTSAARGASEATETVDTVKRDAESSQKVMRDAVQAMGQIESSSSEIAKIVEVIDSIAFQTNLLALNAGVEAARAGDAGRGFAVVASEVRILAHRCSDAAEQINKLISDSTGHVQEGVSLIDSTSQALETILNGIRNMSKNVSEIAVSAQEQSNGISEINVAVEQLDRATQQNAAMFEETTAASQSLTAEAGKLAQLVAGFQVSDAVDIPDESRMDAMNGAA